MNSPADPLYYQTIELPDGLHEGQWDCRKVVDQYLGHCSFAGKTVLEVGPANGFLTFAMEARGAHVTCIELGEKGGWDFVPGPLIDHVTVECEARSILQRIEAAFWHAHALTNSRAEMRYGTIYEARDLVAPHQIGMVGNVLQHLRDPFGGLMAIADRVTETLIITESLWVETDRFFSESFMQLIPRAELPRIFRSWWQVSVPLLGEILKMLGFPHLRAEFHHPTLRQATGDRLVKHVTYVGSRQAAP